VKQVPNLKNYAESQKFFLQKICCKASKKSFNKNFCSKAFLESFVKFRENDMVDYKMTYEKKMFDNQLKNSITIENSLFLN